LRKSGRQGGDEGDGGNRHHKMERIGDLIKTSFGWMSRHQYGVDQGDGQSQRSKPNRRAIGPAGQPAIDNAAITDEIIDALEIENQFNWSKL